MTGEEKNECRWIAEALTARDILAEQEDFPNGLTEEKRWPGKEEKAS